jgi:uncharacterized protein
LLIGTEALWGAKVVYALTSGDYSTVEQRLVRNVEGLQRYYKAQGETLEVAVVIYGNAYELVKKRPMAVKTTHAHRHLKEGLMHLKEAYGVQFDICAAGMRKRGITPEEIYDFIQPVFNKDVGLITWQNQGYAYIEIR